MHKMTDFVNDVKEFDGWLVDMEMEGNQGIGEVEKSCEHLQVKKELLENNLKAVDEQMKENQVFRGKILELIADCEGIKLLPPASKATVFMRKIVKQKMAHMKKTVGFVKHISVSEGQINNKTEEVQSHPLTS